MRPREEEKERPAHAMGEVLKHGADPQDNTAAQRAWLYGRDAGLDVLTRGAPRAADKGYMSLAITGKEVPVAKGRKGIITLTQSETNLRPGVNVWADEIN